MKQVILSAHAQEQCHERGATADEVIRAIREGVSEAAKRGRRMARFNYSFRNQWNGKWYAIKQVASVYFETEESIIVVTVYTFYF